MSFTPTTFIFLFNYSPATLTNESLISSLLKKRQFQLLSEINAE